MKNMTIRAEALSHMNEASEALRKATQGDCRRGFTADELAELRRMWDQLVAFKGKAERITS